VRAGSSSPSWSAWWIARGSKAEGQGPRGWPFDSERCSGSSSRSPWFYLAHFIISKSPELALPKTSSKDNSWNLQKFLTFGTIDTLWWYGTDLLRCWRIVCTHLLKFSLLLARNQKIFLETEVRRLLSLHKLQFGFKRINLKMKLVEVEIGLVGLSVVNCEHAVIQRDRHFLINLLSNGLPREIYDCVYIPVRLSASVALLCSLAQLSAARSS